MNSGLPECWCRSCRVAEFFSDLQLWLLANLQPLKLQGWLVSYLKFHSIYYSFGQEASKKSLKLFINGLHLLYLKLEIENNYTFFKFLLYLFWSCLNVYIFHPSEHIELQKSQLPSQKANRSGDFWNVSVVCMCQ